jgi:hypothetical protein
MTGTKVSGEKCACSKVGVRVRVNTPNQHGEISQLDSSQHWNPSRHFVHPARSRDFMLARFKEEVEGTERVARATVRIPRLDHCESFQKIMTKIDEFAREASDSRVGFERFGAVNDNPVTGICGVDDRV